MRNNVAHDSDAGRWDAFVSRMNEVCRLRARGLYRPDLNDPEWLQSIADETMTFRVDLLRRPPMHALREMRRRDAEGIAKAARARAGRWPPEEQRDAQCAEEVKRLKRMRGWSNSQIATELRISPARVRRILARKIVGTL